MNLNHIHFVSAWAEETKTFYETFFAFKLRKNLKGTLVLANENDFLLAIDPVDAVSPSTPASFHFGFCVNSPSVVRDLYAQMKESGVLFSQELKEISENALNFYCFDPHGNRVEVGWYRNL